MTGVLPGSYTLSALAFEDGRRYQASHSIDITNIDAEGVQLTPLSGMDVRGQVVWDAKPSVDQNGVRVFARSADTSFAYFAQNRIASNGAFLLHELPEGLYRITASGLSPDCYLKSIRYAGMEVSDDEFKVIRGTQATLEVTIGTRGAQVQGTVKDAGGLPAAGVWVVLVPEEAHRNEFRLFKQTTTDSYGRYNLRGIAPGDYKLFSWEPMDELYGWEDPDFLKPFESKGQSISLQEGDGKSFELVVIRSANQEQEKQ
jgi:hypothetical protein